MTVVKINNWDPEKTLSMSSSPNTDYGENKENPNGWNQKPHYLSM